MKFYLAANYTGKDRMETISEKLKGLGHSTTSRWTTGMHDGCPNLVAAEEDLRDIRNADALVFFSETMNGSRGRGGKHVEYGYALALEKIVVLVGERINVFHYLGNVLRFATEEQFILWLEELNYRGRT